MIFIVGQHGSGKNTVADFFISDFRVLHIDISLALKDDKKQKWPEMNIPDWVNHVVSTYGLGYFADVAQKATLCSAEHAKQLGQDYDEVLFTGCRTPDILYPLRDFVVSRQDLFSDQHRSLHVLKVDAPRETLTKRILQRDSGVTVLEIEEMLRGDMEHGLDEIFEISNVTIINTGTLDELRRTVRLVVENDFGIKSINKNHNAEGGSISKEREI